MNVQNVRKKRRQIIIITVHTHTQNKENNKQTIYSNKLYSNDDNIHQTRSLKTTQKHHNTHTHLAELCAILSRKPKNHRLDCNETNRTSSTLFRICTQK